MERVEFSIKDWRNHLSLGLDLVPFLLMVTFFSLPMSSTGKSISLSLAVASILLTPSYRAKLKKLLTLNWTKAAIILFLIALAACVWSPADYNQRLMVVEKYSKLLYLPILVAGFVHGNTRRMAIHAFLLSMVIICFLTLIVSMGYWTNLAISPDHLFRNHIMIGLMVALAAYFALVLGQRQNGFWRAIYWLLALLFSFEILFINGGRMAYLTYALLMGLFMVQICSWRQTLIGVFLLLSLFGLNYWYSPVMQSRVDIALQEIKDYQHNKNTSFGYRLQFQNYSKMLFLRHPWLGNGTGSFSYLYGVEKPVPSWFWKLLEPHNQYWLIAAEFGLLGIAALIAFFLSLFKASIQLNEMRAIAWGILSAFLVGNLTDSLLFYSGSGYLFILFMALCLGESIEMESESVSHRL